MALTAHAAEAEVRNLCRGLRERFRDDVPAWLNLNPRAPQEPPPGLPALPPAPVLPALVDLPDVAEIPAVAAEIPAVVEVPVAQRPRGRPRYTAAKAKASNDRRRNLRAGFS